jgi:hypothetical protein
LFHRTFLLLRFFQNFILQIVLLVKVAGTNY